MKTIKDAILLLCLASATIVILFSCQKEKESFETHETTATQLEKAKKEIANQIRISGIPETFEINKRVNPVILDKDWNIVESSNNNTAGLSACLGNVANYIDVLRFTRAYVCGNGYILSAEYNISWDNDLVVVSPFLPSLKTSGTFRLQIPGNASAHNDVSTSVTITALGADPLYPGSNVFNLRVESTPGVYLSPALVNTSGAILRVGAKFVSDCSSFDQDNFPLTSVLGLFMDMPLGSGPCTRNDKAWYQGPGALGGPYQIGIFGNDPLSACPSYAPGVAASYQKVQYSLDNGVTWNPYATAGSAYTGINGTDYVTRWDYGVSPVLASGTYNVKYRYANVALNSGVAMGTVPTSTNSCISGGWASIFWTEESKPGVVIP